MCLRLLESRVSNLLFINMFQFISESEHQELLTNANAKQTHVTNNNMLNARNKKIGFKCEKLIKLNILKSPPEQDPFNQPARRRIPPSKWRILKRLTTC